jgi:hypothetical protein
MAGPEAVTMIIAVRSVLELVRSMALDVYYEVRHWDDVDGSDME